MPWKSSDGKTYTEQQVHAAAKFRRWRMTETSPGSYEVKDRETGETFTLTRDGQERAPGAGPAAQ